MTHRSLTKEEFFAEFLPAKSPHSTEFGDPYFWDLETVQSAPEAIHRNRWTVVETDGNWYAVQGLAFVNRIGAYMMTQHAWNEEDTVEAKLTEDDIEEGEFE